MIRKGGFSVNNKDKRRSSLTLGERMMFLAGILFCLVLITTALMSGLFARYCIHTQAYCQSEDV